MGKRGPAPLPSAIKRLHGETRPHRVSPDEPKPTGQPTMPSAMSAAAKAIWRRVMRDYASTGVLTAVDADALRIYCEAMARYEKTAPSLEKTGPLIRSARGDNQLVRNPLVQIVRDEAELVLSFARQLGFTPSSRTSLTTSGDAAGDDPLERWKAG